MEQFVAERSLLVVHDYFAIRGGGERLVLELANGLCGNVLTAYRTSESYSLEAFPESMITLDIASAMRRRGLGALAMAVAFARNRSKVANYETRVFSGTCAPFAAPKKTPGRRNILYCHTPPRVLYDKRAYHLERASFPRSLATVTFGEAFRVAYERQISRMDIIVANSRTVQERIRRFLGRDSVVVYPPCDTNKFRWIEQGDFYLSTARLAELKRIEIIIDAFKRLPGKRLVVASGGELEQVLRARAEGAGNIIFTGWIDDAALVNLVGRAIATIYVPFDEDFGMSPVESMAAGKPVIGVAEGGLLETVVDGETGILLSSGFTSSDLVNAVNLLDKKLARSMRSACEARSSLFSREHFHDGMRAIFGW